MKQALLLLSVFALMFSCYPAFAAEELTDVQTVSPLMDQILVWLGAAVGIAAILAGVLPPHWRITQILARFATDMRGIRQPDPLKTSKAGKSLTLLVLFASLAGGCAFWRDSVVPTVAECAPDKSSVIEGLADVLDGQNAFDVLDRWQREKGAELVLCALQRFLERVASTPETADQRATARAYLEREQSK